MASAVEEAFHEGRHLVVEAGTGVGKSLAYLVPALLADEPVILSTGTRNLQDQLVERELPVALDATGVDTDVVLLKGRQNYLCKKRLEELEAEPLLDGLDEVAQYRALVAWSRFTQTGDRAEVSELPDRSRLWERLDGRAEICTGQKCPLYEQCFVVEARRRAAMARLVVVNHHLLFADLALKQGGHGRVLPDAPLLVLDEAHLAEDAALMHFGRRLSSRMVAELARDAGEELSRAGRPVHPADGVDIAGRELFTALRPMAGAGRLALAPPDPASERGQAVEKLHSALVRLADALQGGGDRSEERTLLVGRCRDQAEALTELTGESDVMRVVTVEPQGRRGASLASYPIEVGPLLEEHLGQGFASVVATSATLSIAKSLERSRTKLGLIDAGMLIVDSPFDHRSQAALYVPAHFPEPSHPDFQPRVLEEIEELVGITEGRALVLFASHRALSYAAERLRGALPWNVLVQGDAPRERLIEDFRDDEHSVLLGTASFRQGIDVPGAALSLVVVDKLPFAVPDDPLVRARGQLIRERGGNPFMDDSLPDAILALRQSLGRLVRAASDRGLLALLDVRVRTKRYGGQVLASLPEWPIIADVEEARAFWRGEVR